jgi:LysR family transcriptional regulator, glycine cleavage system transcriptional activator
MPSNRPPSLLGLRAFEAASRRLSFTQAARELHVSQAAISRHVRVLEQELGRSLFRRLHRRVALTAPGKRLASELAAGFSQIHRAVEAARGITARRLRIAVEPAFAARWLVPRLGGFAVAYPDIELELEASEELRVLGRDTDIAIRFLSPSARRPRGRARKLLPLDGFPVIARDRVGRGRKRTDSEVVGYRLLHDDDGAAWRSWFSAAGIEGYEQAKHLHFNDSSLVLTAALRGQGVALSAPIHAGSDLKTGRLVRLGRTNVIFGDYWLLEAIDRGSAKARAAFVEWLNAETADLSRVAAQAATGR